MYIICGWQLTPHSLHVHVHTSMSCVHTLKQVYKVRTRFSHNAKHMHKTDVLEYNVQRRRGREREMGEARKEGSDHNNWCTHVSSVAESI